MSDSDDGYHHTYDDDDLLGYELSSCHSVALHGWIRSISIVM